MTQAETLLSNLANSYLVNPELEPHIVIDTKRYIHVPKDLQRIAVQKDHNVETVTFDCPRYWDGKDLSEMYIYVNYVRADRTKGQFLCKNVTVDAEDTNIIHFDWTIEEHASRTNGKLRFLVCAQKTGTDGTVEDSWHSELNDEMYVSEGLECGDFAYTMEPAIITDLLTRMDHILLANDPLVIDTSLTEEGLAAEAKATGDRFTLIQGDIANRGYYITPEMYGAVGDGSTDDTEAIQAAVDSLIEGGTLMFGANRTYVHGPITIKDKSCIVIDGNKSTHTFVGAGVCFQFVGTVTDVTIKNLMIYGDGYTAVTQIGIGSYSGVNMSHVKILNNHISHVTVGISANTDLSGRMYDVLIEGNHIEYCLGTDTGFGYGIHAAQGEDYPTFVRIINNVIDSCDRHSIYIARGRMYLVADNFISNHRNSIRSGDVRPAINIARSSDVIVRGNTLEECYDGHICIIPEGDATGYPMTNYPSENVSIVNNIFRGSSNVSSIWIGYLDSSTGLPNSITIEGNQFHNLTNGIALKYGVNIKIANNMFYMTSGPGITVDAVDGCDNYNITDNMFYYVGSGVPVRLNPTFCESAVNAFFGNVMTNSNAAYYCAQNVTNPNMSVVGNTSGLYADVRLKQFTVNQASTMEKEYGRTSIDLFSGTTSGEVTVTFDKPFSAVPTVVVTPQNINVSTDDDTYRDIQMHGVGYIVSAVSTDGFTLMAVKDDAYTNENTVAAFTWTAFNC